MNCNNSNLEFRKIKSLKYLYEVNSNGTIFRNVKSKKQLKIRLDFHHSKKGYYFTFVHIGGNSTNKRVFRVSIASVVAECWLGDRPEGLEIDHINHNSHDNRYTNLRYVTKSEQMKNRDHTNIGKMGALNFEKARKLIMKPVIITKDGQSIKFESFSSCARFLALIYDKSQSAIHDRLRRHRSHIYDYDIIYLNAETRHGGSKEQGIVHSKSDLTSDYKTAFNAGKKQEVEQRVKHTGVKM